MLPICQRLALKGKQHPASLSFTFNPHHHLNHHPQPQHFNRHIARNISRRSITCFSPFYRCSESREDLEGVGREESCGGVFLSRRIQQAREIAHRRQTAILYIISFLSRACSCHQSYSPVIAIRFDFPLVLLNGKKERKILILQRSQITILSLPFTVRYLINEQLIAFIDFTGIACLQPFIPILGTFTSTTITTHRNPLQQLYFLHTTSNTMSSSVFYKFKSAKETSRIEFDGTGISVFELKREIIIKSGLGDGTEFDLALFHEDGKEGKRFVKEVVMIQLTLPRI